MATIPTEIKVLMDEILAVTLQYGYGKLVIGRTSSSCKG